MACREEEEDGEVRLAWVATLKKCEKAVGQGALRRVAGHHQQWIAAQRQAASWAIEIIEPFSRTRPGPPFFAVLLLQFAGSEIWRQNVFASAELLLRTRGVVDERGNRHIRPCMHLRFLLQQELTSEKLLLNYLLM